MKQPETECTLDEVRAIELFKSLGRECVQTRLDTLSAIAISRWEDAKPLPPDYSGTPIDFLTDEERGERHLMLMGQMLYIDEKAEARERIKQRIANRQMRRRQLCSDCN